MLTVLLLLAPVGPVTVKVTGYVPGVVYVVDGLASAEVPLFPKVQEYVEIFPVDVFVNVTSKGAQPLVGV